MRLDIELASVSREPMKLARWLVSKGPSPLSLGSVLPWHRSRSISLRGALLLEGGGLASLKASDRSVAVGQLKLGIEVASFQGEERKLVTPVRPKVAFPLSLRSALASHGG